MSVEARIVNYDEDDTVDLIVVGARRRSEFSLIVDHFRQNKQITQPDASSRTPET